MPDLAEETIGLDSARERMRGVLTARLEAEQRGLDQVRGRPVMTDPAVIVRDRETELDQIRERCAAAWAPPCPWRRRTCTPSARA